VFKQLNGLVNLIFSLKLLLGLSFLAKSRLFLHEHLPREDYDKLKIGSQQMVPIGSLPSAASLSVSLPETVARV
jgi:hypothetical protein